MSARAREVQIPKVAKWRSQAATFEKELAFTNAMSNFELEHGAEISVFCWTETFMFPGQLSSVAGFQTSATYRRDTFPGRMRGSTLLGIKDSLYHAGLVQEVFSHRDVTAGGEIGAKLPPRTRPQPDAGRRESTGLLLPPICTSHDSLTGVLLNFAGS